MTLTIVVFGKWPFCCVPYFLYLFGIFLKNRESELSRLNPEYKRKYVQAAQVHANNLWKQAQALFNQFNATRDVADHPLQAANAYKSIVEALKMARQAAEAAGEAAETAYGRAYPDDVDLSLVEQAKISRDKSRDLVQKSERLQVVVSSHKEQLKGEQIKLDSVDSICSPFNCSL